MSNFSCHSLASEWDAHMNDTAQAPDIIENIVSFYPHLFTKNLILGLNKKWHNAVLLYHRRQSIKTVKYIPAKDELVQNWKNYIHRFEKYTNNVSILLQNNDTVDVVTEYRPGNSQGKFCQICCHSFNNYFDKVGFEQSLVLKVPTKIVDIIDHIQLVIQGHEVSSIEKYILTWFQTKQDDYFCYYNIFIGGFDENCLRYIEGNFAMININIRFDSIDIDVDYSQIVAIRHEKKSNDRWKFVGNKRALEQEQKTDSFFGQDFDTFFAWRTFYSSITCLYREQNTDNEISGFLHSHSWTDLIILRCQMQSKGCYPDAIYFDAPSVGQISFSQLSKWTPHDFVLPELPGKAPWEVEESETVLWYAISLIQQRPTLRLNTKYNKLRSANDDRLVIKFSGPQNKPLGFNIFYFNQNFFVCSCNLGGLIYHA